jgi:hypothetical protein
MTDWVHSFETELATGERDMPMEKLYLQDEVMTPNGEGKVCAFGLHQKTVKVWVESFNQYQWFDREEIMKL